MVLTMTLVILQGMNPILASALVPGWGEWIQGRRDAARVFFMVEGSVWVGYSGFTYLGHKSMTSSRAYAVEHAGANPLRTDDQYFETVEDYMSSDDYNFVVERDASYYFPDDPLGQQVYIENNAYLGADQWAWDTLASRTSYSERRRIGREHLRRASMLTGFLLINRIVSVINVTILGDNERLGLCTEPQRLGLVYRF